MSSEFHRVYARLDDTLWVGVNWLAKQRPLTRDDEYVTLETTRRSEVCLTLPDGRILCDYGPEHEHNEPPQVIEDDDGVR